MATMIVAPPRRAHSDESPFDPRIILVITAVGALAFMAMLVLGAYAPDLRSGRNGGSHALSNAATGFAGVVQLARETGRNPVIIRATADLSNEDLAVVTPDDASANLTDILARRGPRLTLVVLPKWSTVADGSRSGWVRVKGLVPAGDPEGVLGPDVQLRISRSRGRGEPLVNEPNLGDGVHFLAPAVVQTINGSDIRPVISTKSGRIVLGRVGTRNLYVLGDPDLLNNHAMGSEVQARSALNLLDSLNSTGADGILFDVTANGLGRSRSPLKLAFDPPFVGVTLIIVAALLLAAWQAAARFGPVRRPERAIAFGKAALVDNSAALVRKAGREAHLGARYANVIRESAITMFGLRPHSDSRSLAERIDALNPKHNFEILAAAADHARDRQELLEAARSLNQWLKEIQQ